MKRWTFRLLAGVSLALLFMTAAAWVRSYFAYDRISVAIGSEKLLVFQSFGGTLQIETWPRWNLEYFRYEPALRWTSQPFDSVIYGRLTLRHFPTSFGFETKWKYSWPTPNAPMNLLAWPRKQFLQSWLPYWVGATLFWILGIGCLIGARKRPTTHRRGQPICPNCGYDVRATPDCCPECGAVPAVP